MIDVKTARMPVSFVYQCYGTVFDVHWILISIRKVLQAKILCISILREVPIHSYWEFSIHCEVVVQIKVLYF